MTYAEVLFLQAEAAARGRISGDPGKPDATTRTRRSTVRPTATSRRIWSSRRSPILGSRTSTSKWIALRVNWIEAWSTWYRTDSPELLPGPDLLVNRTPIPFSYPDSEQSLKCANLESAILRQDGGLEVTTPVWSDVN